MPGAGWGGGSVMVAVAIGLSFLVTGARSWRASARGRHVSSAGWPPSSLEQPATVVRW